MTRRTGYILLVLAVALLAYVVFGPIGLFILLLLVVAGVL